MCTFSENHSWNDTIWIITVNISIDLRVLNLSIRTDFDF
jgi:hypothetical protein